jgi:hypothetical protein
LKYGGLYLERREYYQRLAYRLRRYAVFLAKAVVKMKFRNPAFRQHHFFALGHLLRSIPRWSFAPVRRSTKASSRP